MINSQQPANDPQADIEHQPKRSMIGRIADDTINYDFCPDYNKYVYWMKRPVGWVICGAIVSALVGLIIGPQGFILMWAFLALLLIGCVWPWLGTKGLTCQLQFESPNSEEGQNIAVALHITNRWPFPVFGLTVDGAFLQDVDSEEDHSVVALQKLPAWSANVFRWDLIPRATRNSPYSATGNSHRVSVRVLSLQTIRGGGADYCLATMLQTSIQCRRSTATISTSPESRAIDPATMVMSLVPENIDVVIHCAT